MAEEISGQMSEEVSGAKWYVVHTYSGYENKVRENIIKTIENRQLQQQILEVLVPLETVVETNKKGERKEVQRKVFPGYVFINMCYNDDTWYIVRNTRGVTGFVGPGSKPVPLTEAEIKSLSIYTDSISASGKTKAKVDFDFNIGDTVIIQNEAWNGRDGQIKSINESKQRVTVMVTLGSHSTPLELDFSEIRHI